MIEKILEEWSWHAFAWGLILGQTFAFVTAFYHIRMMHKDYERFVSRHLSWLHSKLDEQNEGEEWKNG